MSIKYEIFIKTVTTVLIVHSLSPAQLSVYEHDYTTYYQTGLINSHDQKVNQIKFVYWRDERIRISVWYDGGARGS